MFLNYYNRSYWKDNMWKHVKSLQDLLNTEKILTNLLVIRNAYPICAWQENELIAGLTDDLMALW
jgi:hypothetical protein